jgi:hypothetical protein|nr:MAG TPA: hypothetical protein [Caudoviricetes sp.]
MFIENEEESNELVVNDVPETSENEEQIETDASEGVENVQGATEEVTQPNTEEIERQIEERANKIAEEKIEARLIRDRVKRERDEATTKAKYQELETIMRSVLGADSIDDVITKSKEFYKEQGMQIPEIIKSSLNERDEMVLAKADASDIIKLGKTEMEAEANRIASIPEKERSLRDKTIFNDVCRELIKMKDVDNLKAKGYDTKILEDKDFSSFRNQFNFNTEVSKIYEMYQKVNGSKPTQPKSPGSAKTTNSSNEIKDYYTPEEVRNFTEEDLENPKLMAVVEKSMQLWGKNK